MPRHIRNSGERTNETKAPHCRSSRCETMTAAVHGQPREPSSRIISLNGASNAGNRSPNRRQRVRPAPLGPGATPTPSQPNQRPRRSSGCRYRHAQLLAVSRPPLGTHLPHVAGAVLSQVLLASESRPFRDNVERALHSSRAAVHYVRVNHRRTHVAMPQQLLDCSNIVPRLKKMRCERVPERVATHCLRYTRLEHRTAHVPLQHSLVQMMSTTLACSLVRVKSRRRKDPLSGPLAASVRILPGECIRQRYCSRTIRQIALVLTLHTEQVRSEGGL